MSQALSIERFDIEGVLRLRPAVFEDARGAFSETYSARAFAAQVGDVAFVQDNVSLSLKRGTVRGLHFQAAPQAQAKLVRVLRGAILDVAVDLRRQSPTYGRHVVAELRAGDGSQLFVPRGFAHGFCTLEDDTEIFYKVDAFYAPQHDRSLRWNDPELGIAWPISEAEAVLSEKDARAPRLRDLSPKFGDEAI